MRLPLFKAASTTTSAGAIPAAALTNQGQKTIHFIKESRTELRKIIWPTRPEATQTTLIVIAMCVVVS